MIPLDGLPQSQEGAGGQVTQHASIAVQVRGLVKSFGSGASMSPAKAYQAQTELGTLKRSGDCAKGFMWCPIDVALGSSSILVELPDVLTPADVQIHALALLDVLR